MKNLWLALLLGGLLGISATAAAEIDAGFTDRFAAAEALREQGNYLLAEQQFIALKIAAENSGAVLQQAMVGAALGYNQYLAGHEQLALTSLKTAEHLAEPLHTPALTALIKNYLGLVYKTINQPETARQYFTDALNNARLARQTELALSIKLNQADLEAIPDRHFVQLMQLRSEVIPVADKQLKARLLLTLAEQLLALPVAQLLPEQAAQWQPQTYQVLNTAYETAISAQNLRLQSLSTGYLARLYDSADRPEEALRWLDKAGFDAQQENQVDLLMRWQTHSGQLWQRLGRLDKAAAAFRQAGGYLQQLRYSLPVNLHTGQSAIKELIEPVYRGLADVELQSAATGSPEQRQSHIRAAIDAMETIKQTELEDFFKDRCLLEEGATVNLKDALLPAAMPEPSAKSVDLAQTRATAVGILYPVILPDRIELLFRNGRHNHFERKTVAVNAAELSDTALEMARYLRDGKGNYRPASRKLYKWLLAVYENELKNQGINTLVVVPDGVLRQVPFAALLNEKTFLLENYNVVTLPGLTLKKVPVAEQPTKLLIAALSHAEGAAVEELLRTPAFLSASAASAPETSAIPAAAKQALLARLNLPHVADEVAALQKSFAATTLLNQNFTYNELKAALESGAYSNIHIASHGYFGKSAEESFIITHDRKLNIGDFQALLNNDAVKKQPIDLLTLSACQTAEGDDRALLGFSGMAIKSHALSAIGSLWAVHDEATAELMGKFYAQLNQAPKAESLRKAQLGLLQQQRFRHPHYWAPFILAGNW